ncbi:hypothetical protein PV941_12555, partial [Ligilactobacillus salivarius]|nr:hypothetical protein [Ligilactobacillus salivarius]
IRLAFVAKLADPHTDGTLKLEESESTEEERPTLERLNTLKDANVLKHREIISWFSKSLTESLLDDRYEHLPKTWIGPVARFGPVFPPCFLGYDLYSGRFGPALALAVAVTLFSDYLSFQASYDLFALSASLLSYLLYSLRPFLLSRIGAF